MGKTAFALNIARNVGMLRNPRKTVAVFSLEMSKEQLALRMLCAEGHGLIPAVCAGDIWTNRSGDASSMLPTICRMSRCSLMTSGLSALDIRAKARRLQAEHGLSLIIVDYLQLLRGRGRVENRQQENLRDQSVTESSGQRAQGSGGCTLPAEPRRGTTRGSYATAGGFT